MFILTVGIQLVWAAYAANFLLGLVSYITAPTIFSFVIYAGSYFALKSNDIFVKDKALAEKYRNSALTDEQLEIYAEKIKNLVTIEKIYRNPHLTLPKFARQLTVSPHLASEVINRYFHRSFADFINSYRLEEARQLLENPEKCNEKISAIAFDCGYGTLSAFNTIFKKNTRMTPSDYRKRHCK
jgi:AraC-like DNA-binding protein